MPKISKAAAAHADHGPVEEWSADVNGYAIDFVSFKADVDSTPMLKGLPGDRCPCPHWGYVFKGRVTYTFLGSRGGPRGPATSSTSKVATCNAPTPEPSTSSSARPTSCAQCPR